MFHNLKHKKNKLQNVKLRKRSLANCCGVTLQDVQGQGWNSYSALPNPVADHFPINSTPWAFISYFTSETTSHKSENVLMMMYRGQNRVHIGLEFTYLVSPLIQSYDLYWFMLSMETGFENRVQWRNFPNCLIRQYGMPQRLSISFTA